jgi:pimeloyl-ACP methyl ester carboxylesterase
MASSRPSAVDSAAAIPPAATSRIAVPTTVLWGRHDGGGRLNVAEAASTRYGWPLHVIENARDDPAIEQPEAFLEALRTALDNSSWPAVSRTG